MSCIRLGSSPISKIYSGTSRVLKVYNGNNLIWPCYSPTSATRITTNLYLCSQTTLYNLAITQDVLFTKGVTYWIEYNISSAFNPNNDIMLVYRYTPVAVAQFDIDEIKLNTSLEVYDADGTTLIYSEAQLSNFSWYEIIAAGTAPPTKRYIKLTYNANINRYFNFCSYATYNLTTTCVGSNIFGIRTGIFPSIVWEPIDYVYNPPSSTFETFIPYQPSLTTYIEPGAVYNMYIYSNGTGVIVDNTNSFDIVVKTYFNTTMLSNQLVAANTQQAISFGGYSYANVYFYPVNSTNSISSIGIKDTV